MRTFRNPVSSGDAPDPFMTYDSVTGYYYSLFTCGSRLEIFRSRHAGTILSDKDSKVIYRTPDHGFLKCIWAPEMHRVNGRWYIYTSGQETEEHGPKRIFVLGAVSEDPFGEWEYLGKPLPWLWAIDGTSYTAPNGIQYLSYCRIEHDEHGHPRNVLQIRRMVNPWTASDQFADIGRAEYPWEQIPPYDTRHLINEGPFFLEKNNRLFLIYSANGCTIAQYCLGLLEFIGDPNDSTQLCSAKYWIKLDHPVFEQANGVYGPGHASFFSSPDGSEMWCAYHGMKTSNVSGKHVRFMNLQKIGFDETGFPVMGQPVGYECDILPPGGESSEY